MNTLDNIKLYFKEEYNVSVSDAIPAYIVANTYTNTKVLEQTEENAEKITAFINNAFDKYYFPWKDISYKDVFEFCENDKKPI